MIKFCLILCNTVNSWKLIIKTHQISTCPNLTTTKTKITASWEVGQSYQERYENDVNLMVLLFTWNMYLSAWNTFSKAYSFCCHIIFANFFPRNLRKYWSMFPSHLVDYKKQPKEVCKKKQYKFLSYFFSFF